MSTFLTSEDDENEEGEDDDEKEDEKTTKRKDLRLNRPSSARKREGFTAR